MWRWLRERWRRWVDAPAGAAVAGGDAERKPAQSESAAPAPARARPRLHVAIDSSTRTWLFRVAREREAISEFCAYVAQRLPPDYAGPEVLHAFQIAYDELLTNVVMHADGPREENIEVLLKRDPGMVSSIIRYRASPYDPTARAAPDTEAGIAERAIGGLGVHLVKNLMDEFAHRHADGHNVITLRKRCGSEGAVP
jgi:anti-sigma regulatory factor (Ser/Thr protein kinase)